MGSYQRILCVVDLGAENREILARAVQVARQNGASLRLLHVVEPLPAEVADNIVMPDQLAVEEHLVKTAQAVLKRLQDEAGLPGVSGKVVVGSTKHQIIDNAAADRTDLIVIGHHARHGIARLLGSTANAVVNIAPCDVLVVQVGK